MVASLTSNGCEEKNDPKKDPFATDLRKKVRMIAEVGTGTKGKWEYSRKEEALQAPRREVKPDRWCFGMSATGQISVSLMERRIEKGGWVFRVHRQNIENRFPYGLSNVGLLLQNGQRRNPPRRWPEPDRGRGRTALAWSGGHVFFITIRDVPGATWNETADFILQTLPTILKERYNTRIDRRTIMLSCLMEEAAQSLVIALTLKSLQHTKGFRGVMVTMHQILKDI